MKLNKILMVLAASAFVACSSDDLSDFGAKQAPEDSRLVQLDENFVIAGVGEEGNVTRTHWEWADASKKTLVNKFLPILAQDETAGKYLYKVDPDLAIDDEYADLYAQAVGLCWLGQGAVGTDVYTNYQFYHFGWLNKGEENADIECNQLNNGSLYSDITFTADAASTAGKEANPDNFTLPAKSSTIGLNYNSGVYKTDNKAIFGGDYIVYYPFNENFKEAGTIPAKAETLFSPASTEFNTKELGKATFRYSNKVHIDGGDQAADFGMYNLSTLVQLRVATPVGDAFADAKYIDQIVLCSASGKLLKQANLAAKKIVDGQKGEALYASTEGTKTIVANFAPAVKLQETTKKAPTLVSAYITVLPTTVDDLVAYVHNSTDGTWATVNLGETTFEAGKAKVLNITVANTDFKADYIAVDEASLTTAIANAEAAIGLDPTVKPTIKLIGDITLESATYSIMNAADENITITGDAIIVPEDVTLKVKFVTIESNIRVLGKSCCDGALGGRLSIYGGTLNNVTMEPTLAKIPKDDDGTVYNK